MSLMSSSLISEIVERARLSGLNVENVLRELFQKLILYSLTVKNIERYYVFQGGTAVRLIYGSPRFSLDLDFTVINRNLEDLRRNVGELTNYLNKLLMSDGISVMKTREKALPDEGFYRFFFVFDTINLLGRKIKIKLELLLGKHIFKPRRVLLEIQYPFKSVFSILSKTQNQILADKVASLAGGFHRGYIRWRDIFDIYWLVKKHNAILEPGYFREEFGSWIETVEDLQELRDHLYELLKTRNFDQIRSDMRLLLSDSLLTTSMLTEYISTTINVIDKALTVVKGE